MKYLPFILVAFAFSSCKKDKTDALVIGEYIVQVTDYTSAPSPLGSYDTIIDPSRIVTVKAKKAGWVTFVDGDKEFSLERTELNAPADAYYYEGKEPTNETVSYNLIYYIHTDSIAIVYNTRIGVAGSSGTKWNGRKVP